MKGKPRIAVVLTQEAIALLKDHSPIQYHLRGSDSFNCRTIEQNGVFLDMTVEVTHPQTDERFEAMLSIPLGFVLYLVSGDVPISVGFKGKEG